MPRNLSDITDKQTNHCIKSSLLSILSIVILLIAHKSNLTASVGDIPYKKFTVTIDAGHGGKDPGAVGKRSKEKNIALSIALKLGQYIENQMSDVDVFYTRKTDVFVELYERAQIANRNKSDLFISIHVNSVKKGTPLGTSTYVMGFSRSAKNLDLVMQENQAMLFEDDYKTRYAGFDPTSVESVIMGNNVQNNNLSQSLELAGLVQDYFRNDAKREDMGVYQGNLVVLWGCAIPAVLIETGFICTPSEEEFLMSENGQEIMASSIYKAFRKYKEAVDANMNDATKTAIVASETKTTETKKKIDETEKKIETAGTNAVEQNKTAEIARTVKDTAAVSEPAGETVKNDEVEFRVQVVASPQKLPSSSKTFKGIKNLEEFHLDGYYKYMTPAVRTYPEALALRRKMASSFKGAFIVPFKNGKKVSLNSVVDPKNQ